MAATYGWQVQYVCQEQYGLRLTALYKLYLLNPRSKLARHVHNTPHHATAALYRLAPKTMNGRPDVRRAQLSDYTEMIPPMGY